MLAEIIQPLERLSEYIILAVLIINCLANMGEVGII